MSRTLTVRPTLRQKAYVASREYVPERTKCKEFLMFGISRGGIIDLSDLLGCHHQIDKVDSITGGAKPFRQPLSRR
jgi:hypothetical protein